MKVWCRMNIGSFVEVDTPLIDPLNHACTWDKGQRGYYRQFKQHKLKRKELNCDCQSSV